MTLGKFVISIAALQFALIGCAPEKKKEERPRRVQQNRTTPQPKSESPTPSDSKSDTSADDVAAQEEKSNSNKPSQAVVVPKAPPKTAAPQELDWNPPAPPKTETNSKGDSKTSDRAKIKVTRMDEAKISNDAAPEISANTQKPDEAKEAPIKEVKTKEAAIKELKAKDAPIEHVKANEAKPTEVQVLDQEEEKQKEVAEQLKTLQQNSINREGEAQQSINKPAPTATSPVKKSGNPLTPRSKSESCEKDMNFERWREELLAEARTLGISQDAINQAKPYITYEASIVKKDGNQKVFQQGFLEFSDRMANVPRIKKAQAMKVTWGSVLSQIEAKYGVPADVLVAYWGLETDFGVLKGKNPIFKAITTLAYNCRRPNYFRNHLLDAIRIIEHDGLTPQEMIGGWAGELGGMQFTPSVYLQYAVDFDGDGKRDLINSVPDMLASSANFIAGLGWKRGQMYLQEVRLPQEMDWAQADLEIKLPRSQWAKAGVTAVNGSSLNDATPASLLLPMGRKGPAFLAYENFSVFWKWNASMVYSISAAYLTTRVAGASPLFRGSGVEEMLNTDQIIELQNLLIARGLITGPADGKVGKGMRAAIKKAQIMTKLPPDSYPTLKLIQRLKSNNFSDSASIDLSE